MSKKYNSYSHKYIPPSRIQNEDKINEIRENKDRVQKDLEEQSANLEVLKLQNRTLKSSFDELHEELVSSSMKQNIIDELEEIKIINSDKIITLTETLKMKEELLSETQNIIKELETKIEELEKTKIENDIEKEMIQTKLKKNHFMAENDHKYIDIQIACPQMGQG